MTKIVIITDREAGEEEVVHRMSEHHGKYEYVSLHGKHFNSKLLNYATNKMYRSDGKPIVPWTEYEVDELLKKHNVDIKKSGNLDYVFVANMAKADFWKSSIEDERHLALYIKDVIEDIDAEDGSVFCRWLAGKNVDEIPWDELK